MDRPGDQSQPEGLSNPNANDEVYFENIDIQQPEIRIPSPKPPLWMRCWQPIGSTVMNTQVLKEPRGFMRILEWFFAIVAFASCAHFSTYMEYKIECDKTNSKVIVVNHTASYPFNLGADQNVQVVCDPSVKYDQDPPGDFGSDAQFFVFTGVISFLSTMAILAVYVFFNNMYEGADKKAPMIDFCFTVIIAVFWLSASAAWANGLTGMKSIFGGDWIYHASHSICQREDTGSYSDTHVKSCDMTFTGSFAGANISVLVGFLNFFLWSANLWFLYKETSWFAGRSQQQQQPMEG